MPRYFLKVQYHGKNYKGWQVQPTVITVQGEIQRCLSALLSQTILVTAAGRTDTGVHAKAMWMHFDALIIDTLPFFLHRLNRFLPKDIAALDVRPVSATAHARFDALARTYEYHIILRKDPFAVDTSWVFPRKSNLDITTMNLAARYLLNYQDYERVSKKHSDNKTHICKVSAAFWQQISDFQLCFCITSDRFLRNMVRSLVGLFVQLGQGHISLSDFDAFFSYKSTVRNHITAPPQGLYLSKVCYPDMIFEETTTFTD